VAGLFAGLALFPRLRKLARRLRGGLGLRHGLLRPRALLDRRALPRGRRAPRLDGALRARPHGGGLALFWGAAFAAARFLGGPAAWAGALAFAELARGYVLTGFPWALVGYIWTDSGALQWAAWIGPHGLTFSRSSSWRSPGPRSPARPRPWLLAAPLPFVALTLAGAASRRRRRTSRAAPSSASSSPTRRRTRSGTPTASSSSTAARSATPPSRRNRRPTCRLARIGHPLAARHRRAGAGRDRRGRERPPRRARPQPARGGALVQRARRGRRRGRGRAALRQAPPRPLRRIHSVRPPYPRPRPAGASPRRTATATRPVPGRGFSTSVPSGGAAAHLLRGDLPARIRARRSAPTSSSRSPTTPGSERSAAPSSTSPRPASGRWSRGCRWSARPTPASRR
jgi:hypothetical protein